MTIHAHTVVTGDINRRYILKNNFNGNDLKARLQKLYNPGDLTVNHCLLDATPKRAHQICTKDSMQDLVKFSNIEYSANICAQARYKELIKQLQEIEENTTSWQRAAGLFTTSFIQAQKYVDVDEIDDFELQETMIRYYNQSLELLERNGTNLPDYTQADRLNLSKALLQESIKNNHIQCKECVASILETEKKILQAQENNTAWCKRGCTNLLAAEIALVTGARYLFT